MPIGMRDAQAVVLGDKIYLGGGDEPDGPSSKLLIYDFSNDLWHILDTPTQSYSLAVYRSKLVLVGGVDPTHNTVTNKLWVLDEKRWTNPLPPIPMERYGASVVSDGNHLIVAGGDKGGMHGRLDVVDVFDGQQWRRVQSLPKTCERMKSVVHEGFWYLAGGVGQDKKVFYASLKSLIATAHSDTDELEQVWKTLPDAPVQNSTPVILGKQLTTVGGRYTSAIHVYSPCIKTWLRVGDLPVAYGFVCSLVLPTTGELLMVGGKSRLEISSHVFRTKIQATSFPDGNLTLSALDRLEAVGSVSFFGRLTHKQLSVMASTLNSNWENSRYMFEDWLSSRKSSLPPTWDSLLGVLLNIDSPLAKEVEDFFNKMTPGKIPSLAASLELRQKQKEDRPQSPSTEIKERQTKPDYREVHIQTCPICREVDITDCQHTETHANPDCQGIAVQTSPELEEYTQVLEEELQQCHEERQAALQRIRSLTEENEELREQLQQYQSYPDDDMETTGYLRGVDVIGETSLSITNQAQSFHWEGYGLKLHIPHGSLPADLEECRIELKAGLSGEFEFPQNTSLVSAVYWIDSKPQCKFSKHIRMELQHCSKPSSKLSIVRAKCSQEILPYTFTPVKEGEFSPIQLSSYGSIQLSHFSMFGVTQEGGENPQYCASFYYSRFGSTPTLRRVSFVFTKDLKVFNKAMSKHLKGAAVGAHTEVEFEKDSVSLEIPLEGITIEEGWRIKPLAIPVVTKNQVDNFVIGKRVPCCQLRLDWLGKGQPVALCYHVTLKGAKQPFNRLAIESDVDPLLQLPPQDLHKKCHAGLESEPKLRDLMNKVAAKIPSQWRDVGIQLGLNDTTLKAIAQVSAEDTNHCFSNVFTSWRNRKTSPYTWQTILQALQTDAVGQKTVAEEISTELQ